jgi:hypothetical protein
MFLAIKEIVNSNIFLGHILLFLNLFIYFTFKATNQTNQQYCSPAKYIVFIIWSIKYLLFSIQNLYLSFIHASTKDY